MRYFHNIFSKKNQCPPVEGIESNPNLSNELNHYCAQIITYLNSPSFDKEEVIEVDQLIELTKQMQAGTIQAEDFHQQANQAIEQIRSQIPPLSFAWKLLDIVASLVAIVLIIVMPFGIPIALACGFYTMAVQGNKFELSFFSKSSQEKKLDQIEALLDKVQNISAQIVSVTENDGTDVYHRTVASA